MIRVVDLRSYLESPEVSTDECMKRLYEIRSWLERTTSEHQHVQITDVVDLYNASRKCALQNTNKEFAHQMRALSCMLLKRVVGSSVSESLDLLRCISRTGHALVGTSVASQIISSPEKLFSEAIAIYKTLGLDHLSKTKCGVELEEICEDVWEAFVGHLTCINTLDDMLQDIHDLRMLIPYLPQNATKFVKLIINLADGQHKLNAADGAEAWLFEIALELIETLDHVKKKQSYQRTVLVRLVDVYIDMERLDKAEACWRKLMVPETPHGLLSGVKLQLKMKTFSRALSLVEKLQEHDNFSFACEATRIYSNTLGFNNTTVSKLWDTLKIKFPEQEIQVDIELASDLTLSEIKALREKSCLLVAKLADQSAHLTHDQLLQLRKIVHDSSCNATNYGLNEELVGWTEVAMKLTMTSAERVACKRIMSGAKLRRGDYVAAMQYATEAMNEEPSKKSLFACFRVLMSDASSNRNSMEDVLVQLIACDDFDVYDLVAFGREAYEAKNQRTVLQVCEFLANLLSERIFSTNEIPQLEIGILYQNMAQLNNSLSDGNEVKRLEKFMAYLHELLAITEKIESSQTETSFGPPEVLEWFFGVCHNIGVNTQNWRCFKLAAQVATAATKLFPTSVTKLHGRDDKCWVATICLRMKEIETMAQDELLEVESMIEKQMSSDTEHSSEIQEYLALSLFVVKLQRDDYHEEDFIQSYTVKMEQTSIKYQELGGSVGKVQCEDNLVAVVDYVFVKAKLSTDKSSTMSLRSIASQLYTYSLQLAQQQNFVESRPALYALKKLVALSQSKEEGFAWLEQFVQLCSTDDVILVDDDIEWFMAKAWNFGVSCFKNQETKSAEKFTATALKILGMSKSHSLVKAYHDNLECQYAQLLTIMHKQKQS